MTTATGVLTGHEQQLYIGGEFVKPLDGGLVEVVNPTTEEPIGQAALAGPADIDRAVRAARDAFDSGPWAASPAPERAAVMTRASRSSLRHCSRAARWF
jgi:acyl-CoA reductase-like NAD-dependent aldehyde dehydrogenase